MEFSAVHPGSDAIQNSTAVLPRIAGLSVGDRLRIEGKMTGFQARLDQVPVYANLRSYPASEHRNLHRPIADSGHQNMNGLLAEQADDELDNEDNAHGAGCQHSGRAGGQEVHLPSILTP